MVGLLGIVILLAVLFLLGMPVGIAMAMVTSTNWMSLAE